MRERVEDFRDTLWIGILAVALLVLAAVAAESATVTAFDQTNERPPAIRAHPRPPAGSMMDEP